MSGLDREDRIPENCGPHLPLVHAGQSNLPALSYRENILYPEEGTDLRDYVDVIIRRKIFIGVVLLVVFVTTLVATLAMTPKYKASGRLEFSLHSPKITKFDEIVGPQAQSREYMNTQARLISSDSLALRVIETMHLESNPAFNPDVTSGESGLLSRLFGQGGGPASEAEQQQRLLTIFHDSLDITPEKDSTIINISFLSADPVLARDGVNTLLHSFISWQMDKRISAASLANEQLQKQIELARIRLEKSEDELNAFARKAGIVSLDSRLNLIYKQLEEVNLALVQAQAQRVAKEALAQQAHEAEVSGLSLVVDNALIQELRQQLVDLESQYQDLLTVFRPDYPDAMRLKAKMDDVARKIQVEENRVRSGVQNDFLAAKKNEEALRRQAEQAKARALALNDRATQYKILEREVNTNKEIHQSLLQRAKEIDATAGADISGIQIMDTAILPVVPDSPKVRLNLMLAIAGGLLLGIGGAFILEYFDNTVKTVDEISDRFGIPILGVLPEAESAHVASLDRIVATMPQASFAEAIRTTRVAIQLSSASQDHTKIVLITSTREAEGKSTVAANMARSFAMAGDRTLLIDADLRRPRLHRVFSTDCANGLSELLSGSQTLKSVLRQTDEPNLRFMTAGILPPNPAELLASTKLHEYLEKLGGVFDRIVVDGPPAVGFADVLVLSNLVGGVILVSSMGKTHRQALRLFQRSLVNINARLLGSIVNRVEMHSRYSGYYKYNKYYYQPYSYREKRRAFPFRRALPARSGAGSTGSPQ